MISAFIWCTAAARKTQAAERRGMASFPLKLDLLPYLQAVIPCHAGNSVTTQPIIIAD